MSLYQGHFFFLKKRQQANSLKQSNSGGTELQNKFTLQFSHLGPASKVYFTCLASAIDKRQSFALNQAKKLYAQVLPRLHRLSFIRRNVQDSSQMNQAVKINHSTKSFPFSTNTGFLLNRKFIVIANPSLLSPVKSSANSK